MFPLSTMLQSFIRTGSLTVIDARGAEHVFGAPGGTTDAPDVTMRLTDPSLYRKLFLNPELHAGEAYMDGRMSFPGSSLRDFLTLFSLNRRALAAFPLQK
ncbi:MAG: SAM-dependent methyltransferase, partial [Chitinophagales bacterium]|nr:SAM-dependent methyltransferase [Hyphomicrobiales bacterium]